MNERAFQEAYVRLGKDWVLAAEALFGVKLDPWQKRILRDVQNGERQITVKSGHGVGKTFTLAILSLLFSMFRLDAKVVVTAPASAQLKDAFIPETKKWLEKMDPLFRERWEDTAERLTWCPHPEVKNFVTVRTSRADQPDALQGVHATNVLLIADEASGVPDSVFLAAGGSMSADNATMLLTGNPVRSSGFFYESHQAKEGWKQYTVNCMDSGRVSEDFVNQMAEMWGPDSNDFRVRVLGEFPLSDDFSVIPIELLISARDREVEKIPFAPVIWGLDVARFGDDRTALCKRQGNVVENPVKTWKNLDTMQVVGVVKAEWDLCEPRERPESIFVDSIGVGAGVADRLRQMGLPAVGINVSESAAMSQQYLNLRAELWYRARAWLEKRDCRMPNDDALIRELSSVRYDMTTLGKTKIESKKDLKRRSKHGSPDVADAFVLTFAQDAGIAMGGRRGTRPKKRKIKGIV